MATITGQTTSRLVELQKYVRSDDLFTKYFIGGSSTVNGIDEVNSIPNTLVIYYIGGIKYFENYNDDGIYENTTFEIVTQNSTASSQEDNFPIIKDFTKGDVVGLPEVKSDVFIERQSLSVFIQQYRLQYINNLSELSFFAGGGNFNIINNT